MTAGTTGLQRPRAWRGWLRQEVDKAGWALRTGQICATSREQSGLAQPTGRNEAFPEQRGCRAQLGPGGSDVCFVPSSLLEAQRTAPTQSPMSPQTAPVGPDLAPLFWSVPRQGSGAPCSTHHSPPFRSGPILLLSGLIYPPWIHATQAEQTAPLPAGLSLKGSLLPGSHWSQASSRTPNGLLSQPYWLCPSRCGQDTPGKTSCNVQRGLSP